MADIYFVRIENPDGTITEIDWDEVVANDPDLEPIDSLPGKNPMTMKAIEVPAPHSAKWLGHPDGVLFYFMYDHGVLVLGSVDHHGRKKAEEVAGILGARADVSVD